MISHRQNPYVLVASILPFQKKAHLRNRPLNAVVSGSEHSVSSQMKNININKLSRPKNKKRTHVHYSDEAVQRSKRIISSTFKKSSCSFTQVYEERSSASALKYEPKSLNVQFGLNERPLKISCSLSSVNVYNEDSGILLQSEIRPIMQEQLVNKVKDMSLRCFRSKFSTISAADSLMTLVADIFWAEIYADLVMVEKKCMEIDQQQAAITNKLTNEQWRMLIALHRTLLHEHHDFFLAS